MCPQKPTDACHSVIVLMTEKLRTIFFSVDTHTSEFIDCKRSAEAPNALLLEDGRTAILPFDKEVTNKKEGEKANETYRSYAKVKDTFGIPLKFVHPVGNEFTVEIVVIVFGIIWYCSLFHLLIVVNTNITII
jgi:hypothetical protein